MGQVSNPQDTLDIVNWNLEFFGDNAAELPEEMTKTRTIMNNLNADIYALVEVVNKDSLASLVQSLNGSYSYILSSFGSFAANPNDASWADAQKLAFVYRSSVVKNVTARALLKNSIYAYDYWSSGRFPYLVTADVLGKDNNWHQFQFVIIHAKAYSDYTSCNRRYAGALEMKDTLDAHFANDKLIILGDFNDDLDESICSSFTESTFSNFVKDSVDANSYKSLTLPLSKMGVSSISGYPSFLDHVIVSNEVAPYYVPGSAEMLKSKVNSWISGYTSYVSDHYPVRTKYVINTTAVNEKPGKKTFSLYPNPAKDKIFIDCEGLNLTYEIINIDGRKMFSGQLSDHTNSIFLQSLQPGTYFIRFVTEQHEINTQQFIILK